MPSKTLTKKEKAKAILWLVGELAKYGIMEKVMYEFKKQKLDITYQKEIAEWFNILDQQREGKEIEKEIIEEIERIRKTLIAWTPKQLTEFVIKDLTNKK